MGEIGHLNLYTSKKNYNRMKRAKKAIGAKTWEEFLLKCCEMVESHNSNIIESENNQVIA